MKKAMLLGSTLFMVLHAGAGNAHNDCRLGENGEGFTIDQVVKGGTDSGNLPQDGPKLGQMFSVQTTKDRQGKELQSLFLYPDEKANFKALCIASADKSEEVWPDEQDVRSRLKCSTADYQIEMSLVTPPLPVAANLTPDPATRKTNCAKRLARYKVNTPTACDSIIATSGKKAKCVVAWAITGKGIELYGSALGNVP